jgi:hypothetical protein
MSDLKEIINLLPKKRKGRWLTIAYENSYWYAGYPNLEGDFSTDLYASEQDMEGACLHLLSQIDAEKAKA